MSSRAVSSAWLQYVTRQPGLRKPLPFFPKPPMRATRHVRVNPIWRSSTPHPQVLLGSGGTSDEGNQSAMDVRSIATAQAGPLRAFLAAARAERRARLRADGGLAGPWVALAVAAQPTGAAQPRPPVLVVQYAPQVTPEPAPKVYRPKVSRPRLHALDSIRAVLILYIVAGHFIPCVAVPVVVVKLLTQVNVVVGAFFLLSGYMAGYTGSAVGSPEVDPRLGPTISYVVDKVMTYYPLHVVVLLLFAPMFVYVDLHYNGARQALVHALLSLTLTQAWFPLHAEVWNAPTWFLSALSFATVAMPATITALVKLNKRQLIQATVILSWILLLPRLGYSYDLNAWFVMEGMLTAKTHANVALWNTIRFNPLYALLEMLLGVAACRMVMLDTAEEQRQAAEGTGIWHYLRTSPLPPLIGMGAVLGLRAVGVLALNDPLTRSLLFLPLVTQFLMTVHRQTLRESSAPSAAAPSSVSRVLSWKPLVYLGSISFPIFIIHGPLGQLMYKKVIVAHFPWALFTPEPWFFGLFLLLSVVGGAILQRAVLQRAAVGTATRLASRWLRRLFR
eukprot:EG_transcript_6748